MMRKVIWCGTAILACGVLAATMAAYYVAENPDSAFAQATVAAYDVCSWFNPVLAINRMPVQVVCADKPCPAAQPWMPDPEALPEPQEPPMPEDGPAPRFVDETPQVAEPIVVEDITIPVIQETQEPAVQQQPEAPFMNPSNETGLDDVPAFMPYAEDDDAVLHQAQLDKEDFMTQLLGCFLNPECPCHEELGCAVFAQAVADFLKDLVGEDSQTTEVPVAPDEPVQAEDATNDPETLPPPVYTTEQPISWQRNPATESDGGVSVPPSTPPEPTNVPENNSPGAAAADAGGVIGGIQTDPTYPVGAENPTTGTQESTPPTPENTNLQEDPSYHHQYPSCPYTGQCPYTGHCPYPYHYNVPSVPYTEPPQQPVNNTKPKKPAKVKPTKPVKPIKEVTPMSDLETFGVDTMECRPTDLTGFQPGTGPF